MKGLSLINDYKRNITKGKIYEVINKYEGSYLIMSDENKEELINKECLILTDCKDFKRHLILISRLFLEMEDYINIEKSEIYEKAKENLMSLMKYLDDLKE